MRRNFVVVAMALLIVGSLAASTMAEVKTVRMLTRGSAAPFHESLADKFNAQSPDVKVVVERVAGGTPPYLERIILDVTSGNSPDLMMMDEGIEVDMLGRNLLLDIAPYVQRDKFDLSAYFPGLREFHWRAGHMYSISLGSQLITLLVDKSRLAAYGIALPPRNWQTTWTWNDTIQYGRRLVNPNANPPTVAIGIDKSSDMWLPILWQHGAEVFRVVNNHLRSGFDQQPARDAFALIHSLYHVQRIADIKGGIQDGLAAMSMEGTWNMGTDYKAPTEWGVFPLPRGPAGAATQSNSNGIAVLKGSKNPDAAWKFLQWLNGPGLPEVLATNKFGVPPNTRFALEHLSQMFSMVPTQADRQVILDGLMVSRSKPIQFYGDILTATREFLLPALIDNTTALGPAIDQAVERTNKILAESGL